MIGSLLGPYKIEAPIGAGGMGEVFRAKDTRLHRTVAIKILQRDKTADEGRKKRFMQEARAASALNHPNIVTLYDIASDSCGDYLVMEYVPGKSLDKLITPKGLPLADALGFAMQIASALAAAHAGGIVHRDIKPANVIVTAESQVKVLDFGLAKLVEYAPGAEGETITQQDALTEAGTVMGTVAYMSPEQASALPLDLRTDIFSLGVVLYEMLAGQRPFRGKSQVETMHAIINDPPPPLERQPPELNEILDKALAKDLKDRYQHAGDLALDLRRLKSAWQTRSLPSMGAAAAPSRTRRSISVAALAPVLAALATAAVAVAASWLYWRAPRSAPDVVLTRVTSDAGLTTDPALSADGKLIAYASERAGDGGLDIWIQQVGSGESIRLTRDPTDDHQPHFSPDGTRIVFRSERDGGGVYVVPVLGGEARLVAPGGFDPQFSPDGQAIAYWTGHSGAALPASIWIASVSGGMPRPVLPDFPSIRAPRWSPDGKFLMFAGSQKFDRGPLQPSSYDWWVVPADGGAATKTGALPRLSQQGLGAGVPRTWTASNQIHFASQLGNAVNIWRIGIDSSTFQVSGRAERLTTGTQLEGKPSTSLDKLVAYSAGNLSSEIWSVSLTPVAAGQPPALVRVTESAVTDSRPSLSSNGIVMAYLSSKGGRPRIWIKNPARGSDHALTGGSGLEAWPLISPDGARVAFTTRTYPPDAGLKSDAPLLVAAVRTGVAEVVCSDCYRPESWSRDGNKVLIWGSAAATGSASALGFVSEFDLVGRKRTIVLQDPSRNIAAPRYSPDGRWVSFMDYPTPTNRQIFVASLAGTGFPVPPSQWVAITDGKTIDREPRWSEDGASLYFVSNRDGFTCLWAQRLDANTKRPAAPAVALRHFHSASLAVPTFDSAALGMSIAGDRMFMSLSASTGNIWLLRLP